MNTQAPLVAFLAAHVPLQHLYLNNNGLGPQAGILVADALSDLHAKKEAARKEGQEVPYLETVICGRNRLENGSMAAWAKAFKLHNKVREIKMVQNGIRQEGVMHLLGKGLRHLSELKVLDLQDNTFTLSGARALAEVVPGWADLVELGVSDSLIGVKGAGVLAKCLSQGKNKKLEVLRLQYNEITTPGIKRLAKVIEEELPVLKKLELNGNKFTEDDEIIIALQGLFEKRKEELGGDIVLEDEWGLDSLSDLEEVSEDEEEEEEEEEEEGEEEKEVEPEKRAERLIKESEEAQEEPIAQQKDKDVDELAKRLERTSI